MCANHDCLPPASPSRRGFLFTLGASLSALAAVLAGIPIIGYLFGPVRGRAGQAWIKLGEAAGCPVRWFQESRLFMCPCHGGVYYEDGSRASGPPPRGLFEYEYEVRNGQLWVRGGQLPTLAGPV